LLLDLGWLALLSLYLLLGISKVPFHGDESTFVFMSRDYQHLVVEPNLQYVLYREPAYDEKHQWLRLLNGTVAKMAIGLSWDLAGMDVDDLNSNWEWVYDVEYNRQQGNVPSEKLLHAARLSSALLTTLALWAVFAAAWLIVPAGSEAGARIAAWTASLVFVLDPVILMNGRRAMMEGALLCFSGLLLTSAFVFLRMRGPNTKPWMRCSATIALGVSAGLALSSKHSAALMLAAVFGALLLEPWIASRATGLAQAMPLVLRRAHRTRLIAAIGLAAVVFLASNPAWWSAPHVVPGKIVDLRQELVESQLRLLGGYASVRERVRGFAEHTFFSSPQYAEVPGWESEIADEIAIYEASLLSGHRGNSLGVAGVFLLALAGLASLLRDWRRGEAWVLLLALGTLAIALIAFNPLPIQRYYLSGRPLVAILAGLGFLFMLRRLMPAARIAPPAGRLAD
jgi:4-amino-4-deoxy-L-arabinose transferase-like glycosyltransferase